MQCDIYSYGVILWEIITGAPATRGRLYEPEVRAVQSAIITITASGVRRCAQNLITLTIKKRPMGTIIQSRCCWAYACSALTTLASDGPVKR